MRDLKKWLLAAALSFAPLPALIQPVSAASDIRVFIDGQEQHYDQPPISVNYRTLVPLRGIFEALGASVEWKEETKTVTATKGNTTVTLQIGNKTATQNGQSVTLDAEPLQINYRTLVPIRFVSEALNADVQWNEGTQTVTIRTGGRQLTVEEIGRLSDRVVYIEVFDAYGSKLGSGSGFVIGSDGKVITNYHVIEGASSAKVVFSNQKFYTTSTTLATDPANDLALLKMDASNLPTITLGDSSKLNLGEPVVAIGSPLGFQNTLSTGVISSTTRNVGGYNYIQTTAQTESGSSGGALFNMRGEVIGVTAATWRSDADLNLAIPSNVVKQFLQFPQVSKPMYQPVSVGSNELQNYLNEEFGSSTFKGYNFNFSFNVFTSEQPNTTSVGLVVEDTQQFLNLVDLQEDDETVIPSLMLRISEEIHNKVGGNTYVGCYLIFNSNTKPNFPEEDIITKPDGTYQVIHNFGFSGYDFSKKQFMYNVLGGETITLPMN